MNQVTLTLLLSEGQLGKKLEESPEKSEEKVEESEEKAEEKLKISATISDTLSDRQKTILELMEEEKTYSRQEIADALGIKKSRTAQLLNELISLGLIRATAATKNLIGSAASGEGLVNVYRGKGKIWMAPLASYSSSVKLFGNTTNK
ncbi:MAG: winged helix-turn-helix transcriptional regulator [Clostridiales bacterium]|nr:winged helix-turn-helix transcriptional regulator [Clostridiales bacterium]